MVGLIRFVMWSMIGVGLLIVLVGVAFMYNTTQFRKSAATAQGTVVELVEKVSHGDDGPSVVYAPRVSYRTAAGQEVVFVSSTGSNPPGFRPGEAVEVMYQPGDPESAKVNTFWQLWLGPVICFGIATVFLTFGVGLFVICGVVSRSQQKVALQQQMQQQMQQQRPQQQYVAMPAPQYRQASSGK